MKTSVKNNHTINVKVKRRDVNFKSNMQLLFLSTPAIVWYLIFAYVPMFGIVVAFKNYKTSLGILGSAWVGFDNFRFLFSANYAIRILRNTILYNFTAIILSAVIAVAIALMMDAVHKKKFLKAYQTILFLPRFISWVVVGYMALLLFDYEHGIFNQLVLQFGGEKISWYLEPKYWWFILPVAGIWNTMGYTSLIYYGSIIGIDPNLYEAAEIDGAGTWTKIWKITIPMIRTSVIILSLMAIGGIMRSDFGLFYYIPNNSGALYETTDVLDTYIYRTLRVGGDISGSAAASLFQSVVGFIMIIVCNKLVNKFDSESSLF